MGLDHVNVTDFTKDGQCSNCGQCCSSVLPLSAREVERIHAYCRTHKVKEQHRHGLQGIDLSCPFRDEAGRRCLIYAVRPDICRAFLCNQSPEDIRRQKRLFHESRGLVFMRGEFFGNTADVDAFSEAFRTFAAQLGQK